MAIENLKLNDSDFSGQDISSLPDRPSDAGITTTQLKARFDQIGKVILGLGRFNRLIDALMSKTAGDSGADNIGVSPIEGISGGNVQSALGEMGVLSRNAAAAAEIAAAQGTAAESAAKIATEAAESATEKATAAETAAETATAQGREAAAAAQTAATSATNATTAAENAAKAATAATTAANQASEAALTANAKATAAETAANTATEKANTAILQAEEATAKAETAATQGAAAAQAANSAQAAANAANTAAQNATNAIVEVKDYADEKAQEAKDYVDNAILESGAVTSVFGRAGAVTAQAGDYTAEMVGARPNDWIPSASEVGAIPASEKGAKGGVASLGSDGKVPAAQLPEIGAVKSVNGQTGEVVLDADDVGARANDWMPTAAQVGAIATGTTAAQLGGIAATEKGAKSGVATLDSSGKVPSGQLPSMDYIPNSQKGAAGGVASLGIDGKVPESQLPEMGAANLYGTAEYVDKSTPLANGVIYCMYE